MPDGISTPSGSEFEDEDDDGGDDGEDEGDKHPDVMQEGIDSKSRTKGLSKPTREAITQARCNLNPTAGGKCAHEALSDEQSVLG